MGLEISTNNTIRLNLPTKNMFVNFDVEPIKNSITQKMAEISTVPKELVQQLITVEKVTNGDKTSVNVYISHYPIPIEYFRVGEVAALGFMAKPVIQIGKILSQTSGQVAFINKLAGPRPSTPSLYNKNIPISSANLPRLSDMFIRGRVAKKSTRRLWGSSLWSIARIIGFEILLEIVYQKTKEFIIESLDERSREQNG